MPSGGAVLQVFPSKPKRSEKKNEWTAGFFPAGWSHAENCEFFTFNFVLLRPTLVAVCQGGVCVLCSTVLMFRSAVGSILKCCCVQPREFLCSI